jgi:hypothetical protein
MTRMSSTKPMFRRNARLAATPIDGLFAETKEWVLAAGPGLGAGRHAHGVRSRIPKFVHRVVDSRIARSTT